MLVFEMPQNPLTPNDIIRSWLRYKILQSYAELFAHVLIVLQVLGSLVEKMPVLLD
jgi:hypothetical protein